MCGIAGFLDLGRSTGSGSPVLRRMTEIIRHRGPDDSGFFEDNGVYLGHRRLSIIDLATGAQPMSNEDGTRWIVSILSQAPEHLTPQGQIFFPALTLSNEAKIMEVAQQNFAKVQLITEQWYPLSNDLLAHQDLIDELSAKGHITLKKKGSRWLWSTKIYSASNA